MSTFDVNKYEQKLEAKTDTETPAAETATETQETNVLSQKTEQVNSEAEAPLDTKKPMKQEVAEEKTVNTEKQEEDVPWYEKETKVFAEAKKQELSEVDELKRKLSEMESRYNEMQTPEVLAILEGKKAGKDVMEVMKDIVGVDYDKMSPEELYTMDLKKNGFSDDEIQEALELFDEKSSIQKKLETKALRDKFKSEQRDKLRQYEAQTQTTTNQPKDNPIDVNMKKAESDLNSLSSLDGKEYLGVTLTKDIIDSVKDAINNKFVIGDAENGFDIESSFDHHFKAMYTPLIVKANVQKAKTEAKEGLLNEITRADKNLSQRPGTEQTKDDYSETRQQIRNIFNR